MINIINKNLMVCENISFCDNLIDIIINTNLISQFGILIQKFININAYFLSSCKFSNVKIIKFLIKNYKIDLNYKDKYGNNCLIYASCNNDISIIKYLVESYHLDVNIENDMKVNCLMFACSQTNDPHLIDYSIKLGIISQFFGTTYNDNTIMYPNNKKILTNDNLQIIKYLIEDCKININHVDMRLRNCLFLRMLVYPIYCYY
jgi:Ankyrin repeat.